MPGALQLGAEAASEGEIFLDFGGEELVPEFARALVGESAASADVVPGLYFGHGGADVVDMFLASAFVAEDGAGGGHRGIPGAIDPVRDSVHALSAGTDDSGVTGLYDPFCD